MCVSWYGWSAQAEAHFMMPIIGTSIFGFGILTCLWVYLRALIVLFTFDLSKASPFNYILWIHLHMLQALLQLLLSVFLSPDESLALSLNVISDVSFISRVRIPFVWTTDVCNTRLWWRQHAACSFCHHHWYTLPRMDIFRWRTYPRKEFLSSLICLSLPHHESMMIKTLLELLRGTG